MIAATYTVPTIVVVLPIAVLVCVPVWFLTRWATKPLYRLIARWERREVAKLPQEAQDRYWAEKEARQ